MVSWLDPRRVRATVGTRRYTFINDNSGDTRYVDAHSATGAWAGLAFLEETTPDDLIVKGWTLLFERDGGAA